MLRPVATLETPTTCVEVSDGHWTQSTEVISTVRRPIMCLLMFGTGYLAEGAFLDGPVRQLGRVGRVIFAPPDRELLGRGPPGMMRIVSCSFDRSYCDSVVGSLDALSKAQLLSCLDVRSALLPALLTRLMTEALHPGFVSAALVESLGQAMLVEWSHSVLSQEPESGKARLTGRHFRIIEEYLATLSGEAPSVCALARACGFSERYFAKLFRAQTNQSIGHYLKSAQIAKAHSYLLQTELPLKEIAHRLGFSGPSSFSDAFRSATGMTPGHFRSLNRQ